MFKIIKIIIFTLIFFPVFVFSEAVNSDDVMEDDFSTNTSSNDENVDTQEWSDDWNAGWDEESLSPWQPITGFFEVGNGYRLQEDKSGLSNTTYAQLMARIESGYIDDDYRLSIKADISYDDVLNRWDADLRELSASIRLASFSDLKIGRQVMTWGTGDFLFLNDLFPKNWNAFLSGNDDEYLKSPTDAVKLGFFSQNVNIDLVWMPKFTPDDYINGERLSYYDPTIQAINSNKITADEPTDSSYATRIYGTANRIEWAVYGYSGYTGSPVAASISANGITPEFTRLDAYGASALLPIGNGIFNSEVAFHDIKKHTGATIGQPADRWMWLTGYQFEAITKLTLGFQIQLESIENYSDFVSTQPNNSTQPDKVRQLTSVRLHYRALRDRLNLSLFSFYSPTDKDSYIRPQISYRIDDSLFISSGANLFQGSHDHTFFGQLTDNSNIWLRLRYSY
jgi:hypothetical protein